MTLFQELVLRFMLLSLDYFSLTTNHGFKRFPKNCRELETKINTYLRVDAYEKSKKTQS